MTQELSSFRPKRKKELSYFFFGRELSYFYSFYVFSITLPIPDLFLNVNGKLNQHFFSYLEENNTTGCYTIQTLYHRASQMGSTHSFLEPSWKDLLLLQRACRYKRILFSKHACFFPFLALQFLLASQPIFIFFTPTFSKPLCKKTIVFIVFIWPFLSIWRLTFSQDYPPNLWFGSAQYAKNGKLWSETPISFLSTSISILQKKTKVDAFW